MQFYTMEHILEHTYVYKYVYMHLPLYFLLSSLQILQHISIFLCEPMYIRTFYTYTCLCMYVKYIFTLTFRMSEATHRMGGCHDSGAGSNANSHATLVHFLR